MRVMDHRAGRWAVVSGGAAALAALVFAVVMLFQLRFESGDTYPEYSTFRSDPKGCRALYEALRAVGPERVERNVLPFSRLEVGGGETVVLLGYQGNWIFGMAVPAEDSKAFDRVVDEGGRLVVALNGVRYRSVEADRSGRAAVAPVKENPEGETGTPEGEGGDGGAGGVDAGGGSGAESENADTRDGDAGEEGNEMTTEPDDDGGDETGSEGAGDDTIKGVIDLGGHWGFSLVEADEADRPAEGWATVAGGGWQGGDIPFPRWFSGWRMRDLDKAWEPLVLVGEEDGDEAAEVVAARRALGEGELVFLTDTYFASNEGLWRAPETEFLRWVMEGGDPGGGTVIDETHLGSLHDPGVADLLRRYRLMGAFLGALVLAAVYAWKSTSSLVPPDVAGEARTGEGDAVRGTDATTGFQRLLHRSVPRAALLATCYETWAKSPSRGPSLSDVKAVEVSALIKAEEAAKPKKRDTAGAYNHIAGLLARRK